MSSITTSGTTSSLTSTSATSATTLSGTSSTTVRTVSATSTWSASSTTTVHSTTVTTTLTSTTETGTATSSATTATTTASSTTSRTLSSSVSTTTGSSTTAGEQTLGGSLSISVSEPAAFASDPLAQSAVASSLATVFGLTQQQADNNLAVSLSVARRLDRAQRPRELSGQSVAANFVLTLEAGSQSSNAGSLVAGLSDAVSSGSLTDSLTSALSDLGAVYSVTVTGVEADVFTSTTTVSTGSETTTGTTNTTTSTETVDYRTTTETGTATVTTTSVTTISVSTTSITTTTQAKMSLSVSPEQLTACVPLLMRATPPDSAETLEWSCEASVAPSPLCDAILAAVEEQVQRSVTTGAFVADVTLSQEAVAAAGSSTLAQHPDVDSISITIKVNAYRAASGNDSLVEAEQLIVFSPVGAPHLTSWQSVDYLGGPMVYSKTDDYVILSVSFEACGSTVSVAGDVLWSWRASGGSSWTYVQTELWSRFVMTPEQFGGPGDYEVQCELTDGSFEASLQFQVTIEDVGPPEVELVAPFAASAACGMSFDASGSTDPLGEALNFSWGCSAGDGLAAEELAICQELVQATGSTLAVAGNQLGLGNYTITVVATRPDGSSGSASANLEIVSRDTPNVAIGSVADQVSPQEDLQLSYTVNVGSGCKSPTWKTWYLIDEDSPLATPTSVYQTSQAAAWVDGIWLRPGDNMPEPGTYRLRLVLSDTDDAGWVTSETNGAWAFDSDPFVVDEPPADGWAMIYPETGTAASTTFTLQTAGWVDDDLPLEYRFSRSPSVWSARSVNWVRLSEWTQAKTFSNLLLSDIGEVTIMAQAMDQLGSVAEATTTVIVSEAENVSSSELLDVVATVSGAGEPFATMAAVTAVAAAKGKSKGTSADHSFSQNLMNTMQSSVSMTAATSEVVSSFSNALSAVVGGSATETSADDSAATTAATTMDPDVALQASQLLLTVAGASGSLAESMDVGTASTLLGVVGTLVGSTLGGRSSGARSISNPNSTEELLAENVFSSMNSIGDALIIDAEVGVPSSVSSGSMVLTAMKLDVASMASSGASMAGFSLPATDVSGPLAAASCAASEVGLQVIQWSRSPLAYAGAATTATDSAIQTALAAAGFDTTLDGVSCCEVSETSAQTLSLRGCGVTLEASAGDEAITFTVPLPAEQLNSSTYQDVRLCQRWDQDDDDWFDSGCSVQNVTDDHIVCACSQLSATYAGTYGTQPIPEELPAVVDLGATVAVDAVRSAGIGAILEGTWWKEPAGIFVWILLALWALVALAVWWRSKASAFVSTGGQAKGENGTGLSLRALAEAAQAHQRGGIAVYVVWFAAKVLQVRAAAGRLFEVPLPQALRELLAVKCLQMSLAAQLRVSSLDLHLLTSSRVEVSEKGAKRGQQEVVHPAREVPEGSRGAQAVFEEAWEKEPEYFQTKVRALFCRFLGVVHPIAGLSLFSLALPSRVQLVVLLDSLFGSLALLALFLSGSACTADAGCADYSALEHAFPDVFTALLCAVLGSIPCLAMLGFYGESAARNQSIVLVGVGYFLFSALAVMVFLANVSKADGERWLVAALMRLTLAWFLQPVLLALLWYAVASHISRSPELLQAARASLQKALATADRQLTESEKRFQSWMEEFVGSQRFAAASGPQQQRPVHLPAPPPLPNWRRPLTPTSPGQSPRGNAALALAGLRLPNGVPPPPPPGYEPPQGQQGPASSSAPADWEPPQQPPARLEQPYDPVDATRWTLAAVGQDETASVPMMEQPSRATWNQRIGGSGSPFAAPSAPSIMPPGRGSTPYGPPPTVEGFDGETLQLPGQRAHMPSTMQLPPTPPMAPLQAPAASSDFPLSPGALVPASPFGQPPGSPAGAEEMQHWARANMQLPGGGLAPWSGGPAQEASGGLVPPPPPMTPDDVGYMQRLRGLYRVPDRQPPRRPASPPEAPVGASDMAWSSIRGPPSLPPPPPGTLALDRLPLQYLDNLSTLPPLPRAHHAAALAQVAAANAQLAGATPAAATQLPLPTTTFPVRMPQLPPQGMFPQMPRAGAAASQLSASHPPPPPGPAPSGAEMPLPLARRLDFRPQALGDDAAVPGAGPQVPPTPYTPQGEVQQTPPGSLSGAPTSTTFPR